MRRRIKEYAMTHDANHRPVPRRGLPNIANVRALLRLKKTMGLRPRLTGHEACDPSRTFRELKLAMTSPAVKRRIELRDSLRERTDALRRTTQ